MVCKLFKIFFLLKQLAFYLAILWATVFLILCKGLKSFGKVLIAIGLLPIVVLAVITGKMLYVVDLDKLQVRLLLINMFENYLTLH